MKQTVNISAANELHLLELLAHKHPTHHQPLIFIPSPSHISLICSGIAQQHVCFTICVCECLSVSILLKRDMSSSSRKLPQARNNTTASANNHGHASVGEWLCVCVMGAGGELH